MTGATAARPSMSSRAQYGMDVLSRAAGVLKARVRSTLPPRGRPVPYNAMFGEPLLGELDPERQQLERFDLYLFDVMTSPRLRGQIVFEYGTLLRAMDCWAGRRVLDVGTGRSTLPKWMSACGALVTTFDLAAPAERPAGGFLGRVDQILARRPRVLREVAGSMLRLPFADASFDLVTSLSVLEHLDTDFPDRRYVPYVEQQRRLAIALDEMVRVTAPGGYVYITSECCEYDQATTDGWRKRLLLRRRPAVVGGVAGARRSSPLLRRARRSRLFAGRRRPVRSRRNAHAVSTGRFADRFSAASRSWRGRRRDEGGRRGSVARVLGRPLPRLHAVGIGMDGRGRAAERADLRVQDPGADAIAGGAESRAARSVRRPRRRVRPGIFRAVLSRRAAARLVCRDRHLRTRRRASARRNGGRGSPRRGSLGVDASGRPPVRRHSVPRSAAPDARRRHVYARRPQPVAASWPPADRCW